MSETTLNVVLVGDTRVGKTSFVNTISGRRDWHRVGTGNGESTTFDVSECTAVINDGIKMTMYDTPGMNDSQLRLTNEEIKQKVELYLLSMLNTAIDAFFIFESLHSEAVTMRRNLANIVGIFGERAKESCIVLLTKEPLNPMRLRSCERVCGELGVPFVLWQNCHKDELEDNWIDIDDYELRNQKNELCNAIGRVTKYQMSNLLVLKNEIITEANQRRDNEPPTYESVNVEIDVPYLEPEQKTVTKQRPVVRHVWAGDAGKIFGVKKPVIKYENYTEVETVYHPKTRKETKTEQVQKPKRDIEHYIDIVKREKIEQYKQTITQQIQNNQNRAEQRNAR